VDGREEREREMEGAFVGGRESGMGLAGVEYGTPDLCPPSISQPRGCIGPLVIHSKEPQYTWQLGREADAVNCFDFSPSVNPNQVMKIRWIFTTSFSLVLAMKITFSSCFITNR
jgi:hypothetical protein